MKELQSIHSNNIRIAKKLEELGFYKEADRVDNVNLIWQNYYYKKWILIAH